MQHLCDKKSKRCIFQEHAPAKNPKFSFLRPIIRGLNQVFQNIHNKKWVIFSTKNGMSRSRIHPY